MYTEQLTQALGFATEVDPQVMNNNSKTSGPVDMSITERERIERERRDTEAYRQKMETTGRMAGGLAHEFNNVLAVLLGYNELLRQILPDDSRAQTYCGEMRDAIDRAADLTRRLRTFSRNQPAQPSTKGRSNPSMPNS